MVRNNYNSYLASNGKLYGYCKFVTSDRAARILRFTPYINPDTGGVTWTDTVILFFGRYSIKAIGFKTHIAGIFEEVIVNDLLVTGSFSDYPIIKADDGSYVDIKLKYDYDNTSFFGTTITRVNFEYIDWYDYPNESNI